VLTNSKDGFCLGRKTIIAAVLVITLIFGALVLSEFLNQPASKTELRYEATVAFPTLSFELPVGLCSPADGTGRLFVVGQMGLIYVFENNPNVTAASIFINITSKVHLGGFLGLALHPNFSENEYLYLNYLVDNPLRTIIARYSVSQSNPNEADNGSERILMEIPSNTPSITAGSWLLDPTATFTLPWETVDRRATQRAMHKTAPTCLARFCALM
jgi:hypothetical protein